MDERASGALRVVLNESTNDQIVELYNLRMKQMNLVNDIEKVISFLNNFRPNWDEDLEDGLDKRMLMRNSHLINTILYDSRYIDGFADGIKSIKKAILAGDENNVQNILQDID